MMYGKLFYKIYFDVLGVVFYWKNMMFITEEKRIFAQNPDNMIKIANEIAHWKEQRKDILHNKELKLTQFIEKIYNVINLKNKKINTGGEDMKAIVVDRTLLTDWIILFSREFLRKMVLNSFWKIARQKMRLLKNARMQMHFWLFIGRSLQGLWMH